MPVTQCFLLFSRHHERHLDADYTSKFARRFWDQPLEQAGTSWPCTGEGVAAENTGGKSSCIAGVSLWLCCAYVRDC